MAQKENKQISQKEIEKLLDKQTTIILSAVDEKNKKLELQIDKRFELIDRRLNIIDKQFDKLESRINKKLDRLINTLDKFLKRMTDIEDEFKMMKADINRLKKIISEKLGIEII